jgi:ferredoxin/flavodoxin
MFYEKVKLIYFSPTGNSRKVADIVAKGLQAFVEYVNLTSPQARTQKFSDFHDELVIISSSVYGGRVPHEAALRLRRLIANNTPAILVVTYGNRAYEDALIELSDIVSEVGFKPIAGCAFIGEHSWSTLEKPTAAGRPDKDDLAEAELFGRRIREKLEKIEGVKDLLPLKMPGKNPYTLRATVWRPERLMSPIVDEERCTKCGKCVEVCPTGAVSILDVVAHPSPRTLLNTRMVSINANTCVWCTACIRSCPAGAFVRRPRMEEVTSSIFNLLKERKKPETIL